MRNETKHGSRAPRGLAALRGRELPRRSRAQLFSLAALLVATALLYLVGLSISGYANEFYSAAAQAGSTNWWSFLWGSSDAGNSITVDKPPAAIWPMALAVRVFGLSSWSILVPQAIMGVLAVWLLYATVRRQFGHRTGLLAGAALAATPVACLMFRFNNPDALLVLLLIACVHCVLRALEFEPTAGGNRCRTAWMALAGVACGVAFLTKQLQAFLILPGLAVAFLVASPTTVRRRLLDSAAAVGALVASAGWWVLLTVLVPASMRPYIGGSQTNSFLELTFGYNGLGRITGSMEGAVVAGGSGTGSTTISTGHAGMWGQTGITRLFDGVWGTQWSWLAPAALAGIVVALVCLARAPRTSVRRAQVVTWGGWLVVTGAVFSFMGGTIHQYYTVALAPATAALAAICVYYLLKCKDLVWARATSIALTLALGAWSVVLLRRSDWIWALRPLALGLAVASAALQAYLWHRAARPARAATAEPTADEKDATPAAAASAAPQHLAGGRPADPRLQTAAVALALAAAAVGPVSYSLYTAATAHTGSIVTAGPSVSGDSSMGGGPGGRQGGMGTMGGGPGGQQGGPGNSSGTGTNASSGNTPSAPSGGSGNGGGMQPPAANGTGTGTTNGTGSGNANGIGGGMGNGSAPNAEGLSSNGGGKGGMGGLLGGSSGSVSSKLVKMLQKNSDSYRWVAATTGSQSAASYQLATECSVMPIGGFNGSDPAPTLAQFKKWVKQGLIHYYIAGRQTGGTQIGGSSASSEIASWVQQNFESTTVDGVTVYDLTQQSS
jgi:4-amino-4-deoxy-L-arabinose transferase-like glycosyltransferase